MGLIDEYEFTAEAGDGGNGVVRWRREKYRPKGGPCGGDGGRGGNIYLKGIRDITYLGRISHTHKYEAAIGQDGGSNSKTGSDGEDLTIDLPIGSIVTNIDTGSTVELLEEGATYKVLQGGCGGQGNEHFKSATNQRPMQATKGVPGERGSFRVELRLIADVGLVGLPNAGKTSLLNALTNANARVGAYPFTTLDPNVGVYHRYVLADIPGLIEGASKGKGLGHKFLRHISRTRVLLHCISLERESVLTDYDIIQKELMKFDHVGDIPMYVVLTKSDTVDDSVSRATQDKLKEERNVNLLATVSILNDESIKNLADALTKLLQSPEK